MHHQQHMLDGRIAKQLAQLNFIVRADTFKDCMDTNHSFVFHSIRTNWKTTIQVTTNTQVLISDLTRLDNNFAVLFKHA